MYEFLHLLYVIHPLQKKKKRHTPCDMLALELNMASTRLLFSYLLVLYLQLHLVVWCEKTCLLQL